ncbi:capsid [uncultured virus]|uniref:Capsid n=1 Tax=uncultured virus TaxID=340016 RepID=A0A2K9LRY8_9VIRU|nr:capsid [uncultured virus]
MVGIRRGRYPFRKARVSRRPTRFIRSTAPSAQTQGMSFVPRTLGNPLSIGERKYFDAQLVTSAVAAVTSTFSNAMKDPATFNTLFVPSPGTGINERVGRRVAVHSIKIRGELELPNVNDASAGTQAYPATIFRLIIVQDKQTNGAQMSSQSLIDSGAGSLPWDMFQSTASFGRYRVLKDKRLVLQNPNFGADLSNYDRNGLNRTFDYTIKFRKPVLIHFNAAAGGSVADITDNSFHFLCAANSAQGAPYVQYKVRTCYTDV